MAAVAGVAGAGVAAGSAGGGRAAAGAGAGGGGGDAAGANGDSGGGDGDGGGGGGDATFPLYTCAIRFLRHPESMVRAAVRTIVLNIYGVNDSNVRRHLLSPAGWRCYVPQVVHHIAEQVRVGLDTKCSNYPSARFKPSFVELNINM